MNSYTEAQERIPSLRQQILNSLIESGEKGVTNLQLQDICVRWHSRMGELYAQGYKIDVECEGDGVYRYILKEQPEKILKPKKAMDIFIETIKDSYKDNINLDTLLHILNENNLSVVRKCGTYKN